MVWPHHHYYLFSIKQLNWFGATVVLAFSTTVPLTDIAFSTPVLGFLADAVLPALYVLTAPARATRRVTSPHPRTRSSSPRRFSPRPLLRRGPGGSPSPCSLRSAQPPVRS
ncbi:Os11g0292200 [Oryza sativa Japonica Group]|uniref:Os11g0292200 protein n=1 Tax=Oryza sativa subsp. japonica TaxID=39947 RepID=A0A0P0Y1H1_ORYSJ|nr:Os11g0292200 [Oryza sativa Japonica Group]